MDSLAKDHTVVCIKNGLCLDPETGREGVQDVYLQSGRILSPPESAPPDLQVIDAKDCWVMPAFTDVHVHLREPGGEAAETIASGAAAAWRGGMAAVVAMPNTQPPIDTPEHVARVLEEGRRAGLARVYTSACLTVGREGKEVAPLEELAAAGAVAFTDDGCTVQSDEIMHRAMARAADLDVPVMDHAQDRTMELRGGVMHEGTRSQQLGLPGIPDRAEIRIVERDIHLAEMTGCALHIQHVSCGQSVDLIAAAQRRGVRVTAEATPHHLWYCDEDVDADHPERFKMNPPLRTSEDRDRLRRGVADGTLAILATDHAPHTAIAKSSGFLKAPFGVIGLETAAAATYSVLVKTGLLSRMDWVKAWTTAPARLLNVPRPSMQWGSEVRLMVFDPQREWCVTPGDTVSLSRNCAFNNVKLTGYPLLIV